jgi:hypothetical protein
MMPTSAISSQLTSMPSQRSSASWLKKEKMPISEPLEDDVGHGREHTGRHAPDLPKAVGDEAVEGAGRRDVPRHRHVADGEQREHDGGDQIARRRAGPVAIAHGDRHVTGHGGDRRRVGDGHEEHRTQADRAGLEVVGLRT